MKKFKTDRELEEIFGFKPHSIKWKYHCLKLKESIDDFSQQGASPYYEKASNESFGSNDEIADACFIAHMLGGLHAFGFESDLSVIPSIVNGEFIAGHEESEGEWLSTMGHRLVNLDDEFFLKIANKIKAFKKVKKLHNDPKLKSSSKDVANFVRIAYEYLSQEWYDTSDPQWRDKDGHSLMLIPKEEIIKQAEIVASQVKPDRSEKGYGDSTYRKAFVSVGLRYIYKEL